MRFKELSAWHRFTYTQLYPAVLGSMLYDVLHVTERWGPLQSVEISITLLYCTDYCCTHGKTSDEPMGRAVEKGDTQGFMKISVDADTKHILGAAILGSGGDEVVHVLLDVMYAKAPYTVVQRAMHIHPTVAEYLPTILSKLEPVA